MTYSAVRTCTVCGTKNRVPPRHLASEGRCGSCKAVLPPLGTPLEVDAAAFDEIIHEAAVPVLVDFWADWCGPCRAAAPEVAAVARDLAGRAIVLKVNTDQNSALATRFRIQSIPNFVLFRNGRVVMQRAGLVARSEMMKWVHAAQG